jgi:hypothetical protein
MPGRPFPAGGAAWVEWEPNMQGFGIRRGGPGARAASNSVGGGGPRGPVRRGVARRGVAAMLAMLYLVLFSSLALGFYASVCVASQVAHNERRTVSAQAAAESALAFTRYHLSRLDVPATLKGEELVNEVYLQLSKKLDKTENLGGGTISFDATSVHIPAANYINLDPRGGQRFRADLRVDGEQFVTRLTGRGGGGGGTGIQGEAARAIEVRFAKAPRRTDLFNFGVASRGSITTSGASTIKGLTDPARGSIISTSSAPVAVSINGKSVSGSIGMTKPTATASLGSGVSVGGTTNTTIIYEQYVKSGVPEPRFPDVDTSVYSKYATKVYTSGMTSLDNVRVPAGVAASISGGTVRGVLYLEKGASVSFGGSTVVQGVIVGSNESVGDLTKHVIDFGGSVTAKPITDLPPEFGEVRTLTGGFIIAPTYRVRLWGNFGAITGTIICGQFQMGGSAEGTLVGTVIQMLDVPMTISGSADVVIAGAGDATIIPLGVTFGASFAPQHFSYLEVSP